MYKTVEEQLQQKISTEPNFFYNMEKSSTFHPCPKIKLCSTSVISQSHSSLRSGGEKTMKSFGGYQQPQKSGFCY